jgi:hypothetical protein
LTVALQAASGPVHLLVDSTGVKLSGPGEWLVEKHGTQRRRAWRKLHLAVDAKTGTIVASTLTSKEVDDAAELGPLLDQVEEPLAAVVADGAYDQDRVYDAVAEHSPEAAVVVPPRSTAVLSVSAETDPTQRDHHIQAIAEHGRMGWQRTSGYNARAGAEGTMSHISASSATPCAHTPGRRRRPGSPSPFSTGCPTSDARRYRVPGQAFFVVSIWRTVPSCSLRSRTRRALARGPSALLDLRCARWPARRQIGTAE